LVADDYKVGLDCDCVWLFLAVALPNWRNGAETARGVQTYVDVIPAALNYVNAAAVDQLLATENRDPVVRRISVKHDESDVGR
jgi:hypothetical protein